MNKDKIEETVKNEAEVENKMEAAPNGTAAKKKRFRTLRAAIIATLMFTLICGIIYPVTAVMLSETLFPYEASGSVITVTLADGSKRVYGSEI